MSKDENAAWLYGGDNGDNGEWEAHRRFISETYNPIYRQGMVGPYHLSESAFADFLFKARTDALSAANTFLNWVKTDRPQGGDYGDVAMERIAARAPNFDADTALGVVSVFAEVMDKYYLLRPKREMFTDVWEASEGILRTFRASVPDFKLEAVSHPLAEKGNAIAWLISTIGRSELWDHGLAGDRSQDEARHLLSEQSLRTFMSTLATRFTRLKSPDLLALPRLGRVLFALHDSPWNKEETQLVLRRLAGPRVSDAQFLSFLEAMAGIVVSSDRGVYSTLSITSLQALLGIENFDRRWSRLQSKELTSDLDARRSVVMKMIAEAKNW